MAVCLIKGGKDRRMKYAAAELTKNGVDVILESDYESAADTAYTGGINGRFYTLYPPRAMAAGSAETAADNTAIPYFDDEAYELKNALLTAEAAIAILIGESDVSVNGSNFLVTGYGRIGKFVAAYIRALGGNVTVYARRGEVRALAQCSGFDTADDLSGGLSVYNAVINTVPAVLFDNASLDALKKDCFILELASRTCYDEEYAEQAGIRTIWARGLPGQYSPVTAGVIIAEAALRYINGRQ